MEKFQLRGAAETLMLLGKEANRYFDESQPWATRKTDLVRCGSSLHVCCQYLRTFAGAWAMFLPFSMQKLWDALGLEGNLWKVGWPSADNRLPVGHPVESPGILFRKIEDETIEAEKERLSKLAPSS